MARSLWIDPQAPGADRQLSGLFGQMLSQELQSRMADRDYGRAQARYAEAANQAKDIDPEFARAMELSAISPGSADVLQRNYLAGQQAQRTAGMEVGKSLLERSFEQEDAERTGSMLDEFAQNETDPDRRTLYAGLAGIARTPYGRGLLPPMFAHGLSKLADAREKAQERALVEESATQKENVRLQAGIEAAKRAAYIQRVNEAKRIAALHGDDIDSLRREMTSALSNRLNAARALSELRAKGAGANLIGLTPDQLKSRTDLLAQAEQPLANELAEAQKIVAALQSQIARAAAPPASTQDLVDRLKAKGFTDEQIAANLARKGLTPPAAPEAAEEPEKAQ